MSRFKPASKERRKLRAALFGPSGSGKTFTALRIATGLGGRIGVIDTEDKTASLYADRFKFDVLDLTRKAIPDYVAAMADAKGDGFDVVIIDSLSHGWQELLEEVDRLAATKFKGNTWSAWSEGTPKQKQMVKAILELNAHAHIIVTMRSKTVWEQEDDGRGRKRPVRIGLAPEQGKGIEYEFDLLMELTTEHVGTVIKDRTDRCQDRIIEKPGEDFGKELAAWLSEGATPAPTPAPEPAPSADPGSSGEALFRWADFTDIEEGTTLIDRLVAWGTAHHFRHDIQEWTPQQAKRGYQVARKALDAELAATHGATNGAAHF